MEKNYFACFNSDKEKLEKACLLLKNSCYIDNKVPSFKLILDNIRTFYVFYIPEWALYQLYKFLFLLDMLVVVFSL